MSTTAALMEVLTQKNVRKVGPLPLPVLLAVGEGVEEPWGGGGGLGGGGGGGG